MPAIIVTVMFLGFVPVTFAENVVVVGKVDGQNMSAFGSKVTYKDSASQNVVSTTVDPAGNYSVSLPQGTYDVTIEPPPNSGLKPVTKTNQNITADTVTNFSLPSSANPLSNALNSFSKDILYIIAAGMIVLFILVVGFAVRKK